MGDAAQVVPFTGDDGPNSRPIRHHGPDSAQVPQTFFTDIPCEQDVDLRHLASTLEHVAQFYCRCHRETVVADSRSGHPRRPALDT